VPRAPSRVPRTALGACALMGGVAAAAGGLLPALLAAAYLVMSALAYLMYRSDKIAAQRDAQRTPESSLHLAGLLGGWPGALIAQQQFRHKTIKQPFQSVFWVTVVLNLAAVAWLIRSGLLAGWLARISA
jgi:uncharacterized membrane protein YsdA (DUF1294 family)